MPYVKSVQSTLPIQPIEPVLAPERPMAVATGREQSTASPALGLQDVLEVALNQPQWGSCPPARVVVVSVAGISVVSACLAFWIAVASVLLG